MIKSYYEPSPEIKISAKIHFYDKNNFNCLCISEINATEKEKKYVDAVYKGTTEGSNPFKDIFTNVEEKEINKIFEELTKSFNLYTKDVKHIIANIIMQIIYKE